MFKKLITITLLSASFFTISCSSSKKASTSKEPFAFTKNFSKPGLILLVETVSSGMYKKLENKRLVDQCNKYYKGKFEIVYRNEVDAKFKDKEVYRYYLIDEAIRSYYSGTTPRTIRGFFLLDRITGEKVDLKTGRTIDRKTAQRKALEILNSSLVAGN